MSKRGNSSCIVKLDIQMCEKTNNFIQAILSKINSESELEKAMAISEWLARFLAMNSCGVYRFDQIERTIGIRLEVHPQDFPDLLRDEIHIASEIYPHGGHTRIIQNLIVANTGNSDVLLTRQAPIKSKILDIPRGDLIELNCRTQPQRACELIKILAHYRRIYIHIHPDDIVAASALIRYKSTNIHSKIIFVNHADHLFSLGLASADIVYEISIYGWNLRKQRKTEAISSFIGIPIIGTYRASVGTRSRGLIFSGGDAYKFKPGGSHSFQKNLKLIMLAHPDVNAIIVGPRWYDYWWWPIRLRLGKRLKIRAKVPHSKYLEYLGLCSVYLDSYPVTGGTAFTESLISGCSVAGLMGPTNGYGFADNLKSESLSSLLQKVDELGNHDASALNAEAKVRDGAIEFHNPVNVYIRACHSIQTGVLLQPPFSITSNNTLPWFEEIWMARGKPTLPGFRNLDQVKEIFPSVALSAVKFFGLFRPSVTLFSKATYVAFTSYGKNLAIAILKLCGRR